MKKKHFQFQVSSFGKAKFLRVRKANCLRLRKANCLRLDDDPAKCSTWNNFATRPDRENAET